MLLSRLIKEGCWVQETYTYLHSYLLIYLLTHSLTPWSRALLETPVGSQLVKKIPCILWSLKVHYCIQKCPQPVPILSHIDPYHALTFHFLKIHLNIIVLSMPGYSKWSPTLRFLHQNPVYTSSLPHTCYMPHPPEVSTSLERHWCRWLHNIETVLKLRGVKM